MDRLFLRIFGDTLRVPENRHACFLKVGGFFSQMRGLNRISMGKSSSLPASISKISTYFEKSEKKLKFSVGPTSDSPGPILLIVAATAVKQVSVSCPSIETSRVETAKIKTYTIRNAPVV